MSIMVWIFTLAMLIIRLIHLQNSCTILRSRKYIFLRALLDGCGMIPFYEAVLKGKDVCISSLLELSGEPIFTKQLLPTLYVQLDNCTKDNKCRYVFCFWSLLVAKDIFKEVFVSFLMVGHTHDDIDASFGR